MRKSENVQIEVSVQSFKHEHLRGARVSLKPKDRGKAIQCKYDSVSQMYIAPSVPSGRYTINVSMKDFQSESRDIELAQGVVREAFVLGTKGMPFYYRGRVKVHFEPLPEKIALSLRNNLTDDEEGKFYEQVSKLEISEEEDILTAIREENVRIFNLPAGSSEDSIEETLKALSDNPAVRNAGQIIELREETISFLTRQIIVRFKPNIKNEEVPIIAAQFGLSVVRSISYVPNGWLLIIEGQAKYDLLGVCHALMRSGLVDYAEPNTVVTAADQVINPTDYLYPEQWHIPLVNLPAAWDTLRGANPTGVNPGDPGDLTFGSEEIVIAIFDRGIQSNTAGGITTAAHPDFQGTVTGGANKVTQFFDFANMAPNNDTPPNDHGMGCAGVATGMANNPSGVAGVNEGIVGAAPNCQVIGLIRPAGGTNQQYADAFIWIAGFNPGWTIDGVNYFVGDVLPTPPANPADIISNSFGWSTAALSGVMSDMIDYVTSFGRGGRGTSIFWAAGNYSAPLTIVSFSTAIHPKVMAVAASTLANDGVTETRATYTAIGNAIEFCAPSHDAYVGGSTVHNPPTNYGVISADLLGGGNMPGNPTQQTTLTAAAGPSAGAVNLAVGSSAGFAVGQAVLVGLPGAVGTEAHLISTIPNGTQIQVPFLNYAHPSGTVVAGGAANYKNNFGGTSSATPLAAGIAALCLSVNPNLSWVELRQILRTTAAQIDLTNATATGQWIDTTGDGNPNFSQWYGWGRLDAEAAVQAAIAYDSDSDIVVRENTNDIGVVPSPGWHASSPDIWADPNDVPIPVLPYLSNPPHVTPIRGQDNYLFIRVKNVGTVISSDFWVRGMISHYPGFEFRYPQEWTPSNLPGQAVPSPLTPGSYLIGEVNIPSLGPGADQTVKMTWEQSLVPDATVTVGGMTVNWHPCLLAEVSPHDGPPPSGTTFAVKDYNNLAHRNISIEDPDSADSDGDLAVGVVAGTSDLIGVESIVIDRSLLPMDYRVFFRIADERYMDHLLTLVDRGKIVSADPLPGSVEVPGEKYREKEDICKHYQRDYVDESCKVMLLDAARLRIPCGDNDFILIHAPACTKIEYRSFDQHKQSPKLSTGLVQGKEVVFYDGGSSAIEFPLHLAGNQYIPLVLGLSRPINRAGHGTLFATQRRNDGELSAGYSIQG